MWFHVQTDFISYNNFANLWKVRTTIKQGENTPIIMEQDCSDYIDPLDYDLNGQMGFVVSNWSNTDSRADFESGTQTNSGDCTASWEFYGLSVNENFINEEKPNPNPEPTPDPEPQPQPAEFKTFEAYCDRSDMWRDLYVKGLDYRHLEVLDSGKTIEMGHNNRSFVNDMEWSDSTTWTYKHEYYLGGTLEFDVDLSEMPCTCAAGVFLAYIDDGACSWDPVASGTKPECDTMSIMEANNEGFLQQHSQCESGTCTDVR